MPELSVAHADQTYHAPRAAPHAVRCDRWPWPRRTFVERACLRYPSILGGRHNAPQAFQGRLWPSLRALLRAPLAGFERVDPAQGDYRWHQWLAGGNPAEIHSCEARAPLSRFPGEFTGKHRRGFRWRWLVAFFGAR